MFKRCRAPVCGIARACKDISTPDRADLLREALGGGHRRVVESMEVVAAANQMREGRGTGSPAAANPCKTEPLLRKRSQNHYVSNV